MEKHSKSPCSAHLLAGNLLWVVGVLAGIGSKGCERPFNVPLHYCERYLRSRRGEKGFLSRSVCCTCGHVVVDIATCIRPLTHNQLFIYLFIEI